MPVRNDGPDTGDLTLTTINISSQLGTAVQSLYDDVGAGVYDLAQIHAADLSEFSMVMDTVSPTALQLSPTLVRLNFVSDNENYRLNMTGSGIGPVTSLANLLTAIDTGLATGAINNVTVQRVASGSTTTLLQLVTSASGYTITTGPDVITVTGSLPQSFEDLFALSDLLAAFDPASLSTMTSTDRANYFNALSDFGITGLTLATGGTTLAGFSITAGAFTLSIGPLTMTVSGNFPTDFGAMAAVVFDMFMQTEVGGNGLDLSGIAGLGVTGLEITGAGGVSLYELIGPITDEYSMFVDQQSIDGKQWSPTAQLMIVNGDHFGQPIFTGDEGSIIFGANDAAFGDTVVGGAGDDYVIGQGGNDNLNGGHGADALFGGDGNDWMSGGWGNDTLDGGAGFDILVFGADGWDWYVNNRVNLGQITVQSTGQGRDVIRGFEGVAAGGGDDRVIGNAASNWISGDDGRDSLSGGGGNDTVLGGYGDDTLSGDGGFDRLDGGDGFDVLYGGANSDTLIGGLGRDQLYGGAEGARDFFVFNRVIESANTPDRDVIHDFDMGLDRVSLQAIDANTAVGGNQTFAWGGTTAGANTVWYLTSGGDAIVYADVNGDSMADFSVQMIGVTTLTASDFLL